MTATPEERLLDELEDKARAELVRGVLRLGDTVARTLGVSAAARGSEGLRTALETAGVVLGHDAVLAGMEDRLGIPGTPAAALGHALRRSEQYASIVAVAERVLRDLHVPADPPSDEAPSRTNGRGASARTDGDGWGD